MNKKLQEQKRSVVMIDVKTQILTKFDSISQAKRKTGFSKTSIHKSLVTGNEISINRPFKFLEYKAV